MRNLKLIIIREYLARVRNKAFVTMTFVSPIIMVLMIAVIAYLSNLNNSKVSKVGIHDEAGMYAEKFHSSEKVTYKDFSELSLKEAIDSTKGDKYTGMLHIPANHGSKNIVFYSNGSPNTDLIASLEKNLSQMVTNQKLIEKDIDLGKIQSAQTNISLNIENFSGEQTSKMSSYIKMIFGGGVGYLLMMFIIVYGNMVMRSVIEEKTNRIVEIIISSVKPIHLMMGKILGTTMAGITQFLIWLIFGGLLLVVASLVLNVDLTAASRGTVTGMENPSPDMIEAILVDIAQLPLLKLAICFIIYFIGGYFLYSAIYAAIGAAVDNETDTQQLMFPVIVPLMLGIYVGFFSVMGDPHGVVATVFSYIPLTSPIVMVMRIPFGVMWWELLLSIGLLVISIIGTAWLGAKIYRVGILMYGKKPSFKDLSKWLKY